MKLSIDHNWHEEQLQLYTEKREYYKKYARVLEKILTAACKIYAPLAIIQVRAKDLSSFAEKAVRKAAKYDDPVHQFTDLCGARVITQTQVEVDRISEFIRDSFIIDVANSEDKRKTLSASEFGYLSLHYIIQLSTPDDDKTGKKNYEIMGITLPQELISNGLKAEIQVRTMLQHAWAGISHDSLYKNMFKPPAIWEREMNRLAATLEEADHNFARFVNRLDTYAANHGAYLPADKRQTEIDTLQLILQKEPKPQLKSIHALRIAAICRAAEQWAEVITALSPFESKNDFKLLRELGYALCRANKQNPYSKEYQRGINLLEKACELEKLDAQTHFCLAWALRNGLQTEEIGRVHEHLAKSYELQSSNPYYLGAYLESEILSNNTLFHISLMRPTILKAIETCNAHVEANIEIPHACFTIGRFYLYLKMPSAALNAYLDGLQLCLCDKGSAQYELLKAELDFYNRLGELKSQLPGYDAALRLLTLAIFIKVGCRNVEQRNVCLPSMDQKQIASESPKAELDDGTTQREDRARRSLNLLKTNGISYQTPVIVVAGSCATAEESNMQRYGSMLREAFRHYSGIVFSGGTLNGIGLLVGDLVENKPVSSPDPFQTIAYIPQLPAHARIDTRYHRHFHTQGHDFSPLEPLQMWIDLIASDVDPRQVKLLGFGGGDISSFEYRLAIVLGVQVGIVRDSGREADVLLNDKKWNLAPSLLPLPEDRMSLKIFITNPNPMIPSEHIKKMAMSVHENYCQEKMKEPPPKESDVQPWADLREDFKNSNCEQVSFSVEILRMSGFRIESAKNGENFFDPDFTDKEIELMAEMEHGRWNIERLKSNWRYGEKKDKKAKITPYLIPWKSEFLSDKIKGYDRDAVKNFPKLLWMAGLKVLRIEDEDKE